MPRNYTSAQFYTPRDRSKAQLWVDRLLRFRGSNKSISQFCWDDNASTQAICYWQKRMDADSTKLLHTTRPFGEHSGQRQNTTRQFSEHSGQLQNSTHEGNSRRLPPNDATVIQRDARSSPVQRNSRLNLVQHGSRDLLLQRDTRGDMVQRDTRGDMVQRDSRGSVVRFTIVARGVKFECQSESPQAILAVLDWATSQPLSSFGSVREWRQVLRLTAGPEQIWRDLTGVRIIILPQG